MSPPATAPPARTYVCEELVFRVHADDGHVAEVLAAQLDAFTPSDDEPSVVYDIRRPTDDRSRHLWTLSVHRDGSADVTEVQAPTGPGMVDALVDRLDHDVLDASPDRLHLHARVARPARPALRLRGRAPRRERPLRLHAVLTAGQRHLLAQTRPLRAGDLDS